MELSTHLAKERMGLTLEKWKILNLRRKAIKLL
jgi:hypothetical protein